MKIMAISDMHGYLPKVPACDLLLIAGDVTPVWNHDLYFQRDWLRFDFGDWLKDIKANGVENVVGIAGNHDFKAESDPEFMASIVGWTYLQDESVTINGLKIWGSPWVTRLAGWAFCTTEDVLSDKIDNMDHDIDIWLTHAPPYGIGDSLAYDRAIHVGSTAISTRLSYDNWPNLKAVVSGHIHEGYGHTELNGVNYYNVSYLNERYDSDNPNDVTELAL